MTYLEQEIVNLLKNEKQCEAYYYDDHCVIEAGPGSGKTATLTLKIMRLLNEKISPPRGLACLTFNNEAVREFINRLKKLGLQPRSNVFLGTVHSFCLSSVIKPFGKIFCSDLPSPLIVASEKTQEIILQKAMDSIGIRDRVSQFRIRFDKYRRSNLDRTNPQWFQDEECAKVIERYESILRKGGYLDFDDLILIALNIIENQPFVRKCLSARYPWFVIDEYQDLGYPLHRMVLNLLDKTNIKIFAVGDPDQSIYSFTGADPKYLQQLSLRKDIKLIRLELNYRCGQRIIDGAKVILSLSTPRNYLSSRGEIDPGEIYFVERSQGLEQQAKTIVKEILPQIINAGYELKEIAILFKDRNDASVIIKELEGEGIKYAGEKDQRYKRTLITRWLENIAQWCSNIRGEDGVLFKDISNFWIRLLGNSGTPITNDKFLLNLCFFFRILSNLQNPLMPIGQWLTKLDKDLSLQERLSSLKESPEEKEAFISMLSACGNGKPLHDFVVADFAGCGPNTNRISLNTLHSSKGLQFDVVIIPGLEQGRLPSWSANSEQAIAEARRTFYVGFTRARYLVYLLYSGWYIDNFGRIFKNGPSRFVLELQEVLGLNNKLK